MLLFPYKLIILPSYNPFKYTHKGLGFWEHFLGVFTGSGALWLKFLVYKRKIPLLLTSIILLIYKDIIKNSNIYYILLCLQAHL